MCHILGLCTPYELQTYRRIIKLLYNILCSHLYFVVFSLFLQISCIYLLLLRIPATTPFDACPSRSSVLELPCHRVMSSGKALFLRHLQH